MTTAKQEGFDAWALVEIMGHKRLAGRVCEHVIAGQAFVRVDVPEVVDGDGEAIAAFSKFIGPGSIYAITPIAEEIARQMARSLSERPVPVWELGNLTRGLPAPSRANYEGVGMEGDPDDDFDDDGVPY